MKRRNNYEICHIRKSHQCFYWQSTNKVSLNKTYSLSINIFSYTEQ